jgi:hypothetical protein
MWRGGDRRPRDDDQVASGTLFEVANDRAERLAHAATCAIPRNAAADSARSRHSEAHR